MFFPFHYFNLSRNFYQFIFPIFCFYNNIFFAWCCCIHWSFIFECYSIWILFRINTLRSIWLFIRFINWYILSLRFYHHYFCRNFRNDLIPNFRYYNNIFFAWCRCVYWSFVSKLCIFRECFRVNTSFNSWLFFVFIYWHKLWIAFYNTYSCWNFYQNFISLFNNNCYFLISSYCCINFFFVFICCIIWII